MKSETASSQAVAPQRTRADWARLILALILAGPFVYSDSFHGPFIFDDTGVIEQAASKEPWAVWHTLIGPRPVVQATLALNYFIGGFHVIGYHVVNLCIHILAALTLFGVVHRTLTLPSLRDRFNEETAVPLAFCAALLWEVHPLQTQAVTYIIQRMESLAGLFYLLTLYCFIRVAVPFNHQDTKTPRTETEKCFLGVLVSWWWCAAAIVACALGMGSKEVMVSAPLIVLLYDRSFIAGSFGEALRRRWGIYLALAATWLILTRSAIEAFGPHATSAGFQFQGVKPFQYALTEPGVILHYLALAFWPARLCLDYGWQVAKGVEEIAPGAIVIGALLAATVWALARRPKWGFLGAWFFLILAPTLSIMPIKDLAFEHRMYLPLAAVVAVVVFAAYLGWKGLSDDEKGEHAAAQIVAAIVVFSVAAALGWATFQRNRAYATAVSIWQDTALKAPRNPRALNNVGWELCKTGDYSRSLDYLSQAIQIRPKYADAYNNRGYVYVLMKKFDKALDDCNMAINLNPDLALPYNNRANLYFQSGKIEKALEDFATAIKLKPNYYDAYNNRGLVYLNTGRYLDAIAEFDKAIGINSGDPVVYENRARAYYRLKDYAEALADLQTCKELHGKVDAALLKAVMQGAGAGQVR